MNKFKASNIPLTAKVGASEPSYSREHEVSLRYFSKKAKLEKLGPSQLKSLKRVILAIQKSGIPDKEDKNASEVTSKYIKRHSTLRKLFSKIPHGKVFKFRIGEQERVYVACEEKESSNQSIPKVYLVSIDNDHSYT